MDRQTLKIMRVIAWVSLFFGFIGLLLLDGQTFSHAVTGIVCGIIAIGSGLACARRDQKNGGRRWGGFGTAILGFGLAVFCVIQLPSAYRYQEKFNAISRMAQERRESSLASDFHALGFENATDARTHFDSYTNVFTAQISEDHWENRGPHKYALHHFRAIVTRTYKGGWNVGEMVDFVHGVDAPAINITNAFAGSSMLLLTDKHTNKEIGLDTGDFLQIDTNLQQVLQSVFTDGNRGTNSSLLHVIASNFQSPKIERELKYYVANFSTNSTNHFYVGATELDNGKLVTALVYWKEPRILMDYGELTDDTPEGAENFAWQGHHLKLGRDTVDTPEDIAGSTYLETHHQWVDWMEQCISKGKLYVVTVNEATNAFPNADRTKADDE